MRGLLSVLTLLAVTVAPHAQEPGGGSISGRVILTSRVRGTPLPSNAYQPRAVGRHAASSAPEIRNVIVYLKGVSFRGALPPARREILQKDETFVPSVLAITRGSTVSFPNGDPYFHNVFSLSGAATFNLGRYPQSATRTREFTKTGLVKVYCDIHSHMHATILVLDHPYFVVPELDGTFSLPNVPPGAHTIVGWHERVGERTLPIEVAAGRTATAELSLPVEDTP
jgi:hypothetical protein